MPEAIVLDIEGTTSSTAFVYDTLYPFARTGLAPWVMAHPESPEVEDVRRLAGSGTLDDVVATLLAWMDADEKITPLKTIQGWIWEAGFREGELTSHFYPDALAAVRRWHGEGHTLWVFSSGSVRAQQAWFAHSPEGDLRSLISGWFDTETAGPKRSPDSYRTIASATGVAPDGIVFLSDVTAELDAAREAGWQTVGVPRPGDAWYAAGVGDHREVATFDEAAL